MLFHLIIKLHERIGVIITTSLAFGEWPTEFGDPRMTTDPFDSVIHPCDIVETDNDNWRLKSRGQLPSLGD